MSAVWKISYLRFESKHSKGKVIAKAAISRLNVYPIIAFREQFRNNYRFA